MRTCDGYGLCVPACAEGALRIAGRRSGFTAAEVEAFLRAEAARFLEGQVGGS